MSAPRSSRARPNRSASSSTGKAVPPGLPPSQMAMARSTASCSSGRARSTRGPGRAPSRRSAVASPGSRSRRGPTAQRPGTRATRTGDRRRPRTRRSERLRCARGSRRSACRRARVPARPPRPRGVGRRSVPGGRRRSRRDRRGRLRGEPSGLTHPAQLQVEGEREDQRHHRRRRGAHRNPAGEIAAHEAPSLAEREDDRVLGRVVAGVRLTLYGRNVNA